MISSINNEVFETFLVSLYAQIEPLSTVPTFNCGFSSVSTINVTRNKQKAFF